MLSALSQIPGYFQEMREVLRSQSSCRVLQPAAESIQHVRKYTDVACLTFGLRCPSECVLVQRTQLSTTNIIFPSFLPSLSLSKWLFHSSPKLTAALYTLNNRLLMRTSWGSLVIISLTFNSSVLILITISLTLIGCHSLVCLQHQQCLS